MSFQLADFTGLSSQGLSIVQVFLIENNKTGERPQKKQGKKRMADLISGRCPDVCFMPPQFFDYWLFQETWGFILVLSLTDDVTLSKLGPRFPICKMGLTIQLCLPSRIVFRSSRSCVLVSSYLFTYSTNFGRPTVPQSQASKDGQNVDGLFPLGTQRWM